MSEQTHVRRLPPLRIPNNAIAPIHVIPLVAKPVLERRSSFQERAEDETLSSQSSNDTVQTGVKSMDEEMSRRVRAGRGFVQRSSTFSGQNKTASVVAQPTLSAIQTMSMTGVSPPNHGGSVVISAPQRAASKANTIYSPGTRHLHSTSMIGAASELPGRILSKEASINISKSLHGHSPATSLRSVLSARSAKSVKSPKSPLGMRKRPSIMNFILLYDPIHGDVVKSVRDMTLVWLVWRLWKPVTIGTLPALLLLCLPFEDWMTVKTIKETEYIYTLITSILCGMSMGVQTILLNALANAPIVWNRSRVVLPNFVFTMCCLIANMIIILAGKWPIVFQSHWVSLACSPVIALVLFHVWFSAKDRLAQKYEWILCAVSIAILPHVYATICSFLSALVLTRPPLFSGLILLIWKLFGNVFIFLTKLCMNKILQKSLETAQNNLPLKQHHTSNPNIMTAAVMNAFKSRPISATTSRPCTANARKSSLAMKSKSQRQFYQFSDFVYPLDIPNIVVFWLCLLHEGMTIMTVNSWSMEIYALWFLVDGIGNILPWVWMECHRKRLRNPWMQYWTMAWTIIQTFSHLQRRYIRILLSNTFRAQIDLTTLEKYSQEPEYQVFAVRIMDTKSLNEADSHSLRSSHSGMEGTFPFSGAMSITPEANETPPIVTEEPLDPLDNHLLYASVETTFSWLHSKAVIQIMFLFLFPALQYGPNASWFDYLQLGSSARAILRVFFMHVYVHLLSIAMHIFVEKRYALPWINHGYSQWAQRKSVWYCLMWSAVALTILQHGKMNKSMKFENFKNIHL